MAKKHLEITISAQDMLALLKGEDVTLSHPEIEVELAMEDPGEGDLQYLGGMETAIDEIKQEIEDGDDEDDDEDEDLDDEDFEDEDLDDDDDDDDLDDEDLDEEPEEAE